MKKVCVRWFRMVVTPEQKEQLKEECAALSCCKNLLSTQRFSKSHLWQTLDIQYNSEMKQQLQYQRKHHHHKELKKLKSISIHSYSHCVFDEIWHNFGIMSSRRHKGDLSLLESIILKSRGKKSEKNYQNFVVIGLFFIRIHSTFRESVFSRPTTVDHSPQSFP